MLDLGAVAPSTYPSRTSLGPRARASARAGAACGKGPLESPVWPFRARFVFYSSPFDPKSRAGARGGAPFESGERAALVRFDLGSVSLSFGLLAPDAHHTRAFPVAAGTLRSRARFEILHTCRAREDEGGVHRSRRYSGSVRVETAASPFPGARLRRDGGFAWTRRFRASQGRGRADRDHRPHVGSTGGAGGGSCHTWSSGSAASGQRPVSWGLLVGRARALGLP